MTEKKAKAFKGVMKTSECAFDIRTIGGVETDVNDGGSSDGE